MHCRYFIFLLLVYLALSVDFTGKCDPKFGYAYGDKTNEAPSSESNMRYCSWYRENTCCSKNGAYPLLNDEYHARPGFPDIVGANYIPSCAEFLQLYDCRLCSPGFGTHYGKNYSLSSTPSNCRTFYENLYSKCKGNYFTKLTFPKYDMATNTVVGGGSTVYKSECVMYIPDKNGVEGSTYMKNELEMYQKWWLPQFYDADQACYSDAYLASEDYKNSMKLLGMYFDSLPSADCFNGSGHLDCSNLWLTFLLLCCVMLVGFPKMQFTSSVNLCLLVFALFLPFMINAATAASDYTRKQSVCLADPSSGRYYGDNAGESPDSNSDMRYCDLYKDKTCCSSNGTLLLYREETALFTYPGPDGYDYVPRCAEFASMFRCRWCNPDFGIFYGEEATYADFPQTCKSFFEDYFDACKGQRFSKIEYSNIDGNSGVAYSGDNVHKSTCTYYFPDEHAFPPASTGETLFSDAEAFYTGFVYPKLSCYEKSYTDTKEFRQKMGYGGWGSLSTENCFSGVGVLSYYLPVAFVVAFAVAILI